MELRERACRHCRDFTGRMMGKGANNTLIAGAFEHHQIGRVHRERAPYPVRSRILAIRGAGGRKLDRSFRCVDHLNARATLSKAGKRRSQQYTSGYHSVA